MGEILSEFFPQKKVPENVLNLFFNECRQPFEIQPGELFGHGPGPQSVH
jgi:hypothetical protein